MLFFRRKRAKELETFAQMNALFDKECERLFKLEMCMFENSATEITAKSKMEYFAFRQEIIFKEHHLHYDDWKRGKGLYGHLNRPKPAMQSLDDEQPAEVEEPQATAAEPTQPALPPPPQTTAVTERIQTAVAEPMQAAPTSPPQEVVTETQGFYTKTTIKPLAGDTAKDNREDITIIPD